MVEEGKVGKGFVDREEYLCFSMKVKFVLVKLMKREN